MQINKKVLSEISKTTKKETPIFRSIQGVLTKDTLELGHICHQSTPTQKFNPFEHWLKNISVSTETKAKNSKKIDTGVREIINETNSVKDYVRNLFSDDVLKSYGLNPDEIQIKFRVKTKSSAFKKCNEPAVEAYQEAQSILDEKKMKGLLEAQEKLKTANHLGNNPTQDLRDVAGIRFVLKNPNQETIDNYTKMLADMHNKKLLRLKKLSLYGDELSYLQQKNADELRAACPNLKISRPVLDIGYIASQSNTVIPVTQGNKTILVRMEQQIRSDKIDKLASEEHDLTYKPGPLTKEFKKLSPEKQEEFKKNYIHDSYHFIRKSELGLPVQRPEFPTEVPEILSLEKFL